MTTVALAHDYLTQRGGAERVVSEMVHAFPGAPLYTTLYDPDRTFSDFTSVDVRTTWANSIPPFRRRHRSAFPLLSSLVSGYRIDADVTLVSSSGWAHAYECTGKKVVYCHAPARWLYQRDRYFGTGNLFPKTSLASLQERLVGLASSRLIAWDRQAALGADRYLANSTVTRDAILRAYGIEAEIIFPPPSLAPGEKLKVEALEPGFMLCVARLLPYKNVDLILATALEMDDARLVIVGDGPVRARLQQMSGNLSRVKFVGRVNDGELRWLYANCSMLLAASFEDFGLSPLEASTFGRPSVALKAGGYLDTINSGVNGLFFEELTVASLREAIGRAARTTWDAEVIRKHSSQFSKQRFRQQLQDVVSEELADVGSLERDA